MLLLNLNVIIYTFIDHGKGDAEIYVTIRLFYDNNFVKEKCLRIMQGSYNMNKICNYKCMFCKDRDIDFSAGDMRAQHFEGGDFDFTARYFLEFSLNNSSAQFYCIYHIINR